GDEDVVTTTPDSIAGQQVLAEHYPAGQARPVKVIANASAAEDVTAAVQNVEGVAEVGMGERSTDGRLVRIDAVLADPSDSRAAETTVDRIRAALRAVPGADALVGESTAEQLDIDRAQAHDRKVVPPLMLVVIFVVLLVFLRA